MAASSVSDLSDLDPTQFGGVSDLSPADDDAEALINSQPLFYRPNARGRQGTAYDVWKEARSPLPYESARDKHGHKIWYCKRCRGFSGTVSNGRIHLRTSHGIDLRKPTLLQSATVNNTAISAAFSRQALQA
jgi:hypothetical protein